MESTTGESNMTSHQLSLIQESDPSDGQTKIIVDLPNEVSFLIIKAKPSNKIQNL